MSLLLAFNNKNCELPLDWSELTLEQYIRLCNCTEDDISIAAAILNLNKDLLKNANKGQLRALIINNLQWLNEVPKDYSTNNTPKIITVDKKQYKIPDTIENLTFGQVILLKKAIGDNGGNTINPSSYSHLLAIILANTVEGGITDAVIEKLKLVLGKCKAMEAIKLLNSFLKQLEQLNEREAVNLSRPIKTEENQAGINRFEKFGYYPLIKLVMAAEKLTYAQALQLPYHRAFVCILYEKEKNDYQEKLIKIFNTKNMNK